MITTHIVRTERWELVEPFTIARGTITAIPVIAVTLTDSDGYVGHAEAAGVDYDGETPKQMVARIADVMPRVVESTASGVTSEALQQLQTMLAPGGARNAIDCALWDLRAKQTGVPAWKAAGLPPLRPLTTVFTLGIGSEADTRRKARDARHYPLLAAAAEEVFQMLKAPIMRVCLPDVPAPTSASLERAYYLEPNDIVSAVEKVLA